MRRKLAWVFTVSCGLSGLSSLSQTCLAWGARGHELIAELAPKVLEQKYGAAAGELFAKKARLMGTYANVPDTIWKRTSREESYLANQCHYFSVDLLMGRMSWEQMPGSVNAALTQHERFCRGTRDSLACREARWERDPLKSLGHAPWRVVQFGSKLLSQLRRLPAGGEHAASLDRAQIAALNDAVLYAGVGSHFIADLANPMHTTADHDGWGHEQGGLHAFFEDELVRELAPELERKVLAYIEKHAPAQALLATIPAGLSADDDRVLATALALDSHQWLAKLFAWDKRYAVLEKSVRSPSRKIPALRRYPDRVVGHFRELLVARMAIAVDLLAYSWHAKWKAAGQPDLRGYAHLVDYQHQPIVKPDYL